MEEKTHKYIKDIGLGQYLNHKDKPLFEDPLRNGVLIT
jgi:hypothetical protein